MGQYPQISPNFEPLNLKIPLTLGLHHTQNPSIRKGTNMPFLIMPMGLPLIVASTNKQSKQIFMDFSILMYTVIWQSNFPLRHPGKHLILYQRQWVSYCGCSSITILSFISNFKGNLIYPPFFSKLKNEFSDYYNLWSQHIGSNFPTFWYCFSE